VTFLEDLENASQESHGCKVCDFLSTLYPDQAVKTDEIMRAKVHGKKKVSDDKVASIMKSYGTSVGATTVRRHRTNCAPRTADTQS
jgi:hypothetical protein